ncbi:multiple inositol polyphosphate phosphatase 1-like [Epargyreus clarus]|uniref:multiple inositol polyphosphate phosphatase 1-like n=1 Tax=Epargyreus clarus TaxID=520877 RepID=UPI003C2DE3DF
MKICSIRVLIFISYSFISTSSALKHNDIRNHLGTRTPYRFKCNKDESKLKFPSCRDSKIWMLVRHGTRLPSAKDIVGMNSTLRDLKYEILLQHKRGKGQLTNDQLRKLEEWTSDIELDKEKFLTLEGQDEMVLLAERMQKRFPNAIKHQYNNKTFQFRYTATQRAQQSARYFTLGLFNKKDAQNVIFTPAAKVDTTLRFYKHCDKWQKKVKKNPDTYKEQRLYGNTREMNNTLQSVSERLGLNRILHLDTVTLMYKICGYETSWHKHSISPWCFAFDQKDAQTMEYYHDLKHYWMDGYGHELTYRQACMLLKNLFESFSEKGPNATFLFAHSGTLLKFLTLLQMYKPETHLTGDAIDHDRHWKASHIDCFASNLAFVLYKCKDGDKIVALHQERVIKLPMFEKELLPVKEFMEYFHESVNKCNYTDMCSLED